MVLSGRSVASDAESVVPGSGAAGPADADDDGEDDASAVGGVLGVEERAQPEAEAMRVATNKARQHAVRPREDDTAVV